MRGILRRVLTWLLVFVFGGIALAVASEFFIEAARDKGWYDNAGQTWDRVVSAVLGFVTAPIPLASIAALAGLVSGLWLDQLLLKKERKDHSLSLPRGNAEPRKVKKLIEAEVVACKAAILEINQYLAGDIEHLTQRMHRISADEMRTEGALDDAPEIERSLQTIRAELNALISRHGPALQAIGVPINVLLDRISGAGTGLHDIYRARRLPQEFFYEKWNAFNDVLGALTTTKRELQANLLAAHREMIDGTK